MKRLIFILIIVTFFGCRNSSQYSYEVNSKDSANISIYISMLYPKERLTVVLNDKSILLDEFGQDSIGNPSSYRYFHFPDTIRKIKVIGEYKDKITFHRIFRDTLLDAAQRSVFISYPIPKGKIHETNESCGYVPIDFAERIITLEDDKVYFKDTWRH